MFFSVDPKGLKIVQFIFLLHRFLIPWNLSKRYSVELCCPFNIYGQVLFQVMVLTILLLHS